MDFGGFSDAFDDVTRAIIGCDNFFYHLTKLQTHCYTILKGKNNLNWRSIWHWHVQQRGPVFGLFLDKPWFDRYKNQCIATPNKKIKKMHFNNVYDTSNISEFIIDKSLVIQKLDKINDIIIADFCYFGKGKTPTAIFIHR